jgi:small subunit ribosomal protein S19e
MNGVKEIEAGKYNILLAEALKKEEFFDSPEWVDFVKSGAGKKRPVDEDDFWHKRTASILRQIYKKEIVGVQRLRTRYGGKKERGKRPNKFKRGGGKIIRVILQQAETAGLVRKSEGQKKGRTLTEKGKKFLENISGGKNDDETLSQES